MAAFDEALASLTPIQRQAVEWTDGAALVLAGPGAGKTRVLTTRIAKLLKDSDGRRFKVLALTFTTKAATEMRERVERLVPGVADDRTYVGTFHAFCTLILRQHGSHIGIKPDFAVIDQKDERKQLLADALRAEIAAGKAFSLDDVGWLDAIDGLKAKLIVPEKAGTRVRNPHMPEVYEVYETALRSENAMDFNGLILEACRLLAKFPAVAKRIRQAYPYWMVDEFQDTSPGQYWLLHYMSGGEFENIVAVADDDQIIYQWAGASYRQIEKFRDQFKPALIQLVENHRCPPEIVAVANRLVAHNTQRTPDKKPITAGRAGPLNAISCRQYPTDDEECAALLRELLAMDPKSWGNVAILGRTRALLLPMLAALRAQGVRAALIQRRESFSSPQFVWLYATLDQALRPTNRRVFTNLVNAANRFLRLEFDPLLLIAEAEAAGHSYFEHWSVAAQAPETPPLAKELGVVVGGLAQSRLAWKAVTDDAINVIAVAKPQDEGAVSDFSEDLAAWKTCCKDIRAELGKDPDLRELMQGMVHHSKVPPRDPQAVSLLTIHGAKGLEFELVYVIGLAEEEMPSWQSCRAGDASPEMEEERRNCFVAITRTQERLSLSSAATYRGRNRRPSRFLAEMQLTGATV